ncbi:MAG: ribonuclease H family protein [Defluviitaleaceae bacterium]|nr:ribonuclease H family protein [Defluviitaleaceae bacterium]
MKKYYAVKAGRKTGIFTSWDACKKSIDGFSGAVYKSFPTKAQADTYLKGNDSASEADLNTHLEDEVIAYIDGSYSDKLKRFSYAAVMFVDGKKMTYSAAEDGTEVVSMRNVAGELKAAMYAMQFTKRQGKKKLRLFYDYMGIEMWATGGWKAKLPYTQAYANYAKKMSEVIHITYVKVKAHSGDVYNEEVDQLAKDALLYDKNLC